jgi:hypothetical protein
VLSESEIRTFYSDNPIQQPSFWNLGGRHIRICLKHGHFVKLNHFENRLNEKDLRLRALNELSALAVALRGLIEAFLTWPKQTI